MTELLQSLQESMAKLAAQTELGSDLKWVRDLRQKSAERLKAVGFPSTRHEHWRYTSLRPVLEQKLQYEERPPSTKNSATKKALLGVLGLENSKHVVVFVDGWPIEFADSKSTLPAGINVTELGAALGDGDSQLQSFFARIQNAREGLIKKENEIGPEIGPETDAFSLVGTGLLNQGLMMRVAKDCHVAEPIHVVFASNASKASNLAVVPRCLIHVGRQSSVTVVVSQVTIHESESVADAAIGAVGLIQPTCDAVVEDHGKLSLVRVLVPNTKQVIVSNANVLLGQSSTLYSLAFCMGLKTERLENPENRAIKAVCLVRDDLNVFCHGTACEARLDGLSLLSDAVHIDHNTNIEHRVPNTKCEQQYKSILQGKSRSAFSGKIFVRRQAQQTLARQNSRFLLLSREAEADTRPQLEIDADDVKCAHGATVGQLNEAEIFYLQSRGIPRALAQAMLSEAFASDILNAVPDEKLRAYLSRFTAAYFAPRTLAEASKNNQLEGQ